jgi:enoyl-CoA hydratase/carnithine racemase
LDIDLCDEQGSICAKIRGVGFQPASLEIVDQAVDEPVFATAPAVRITASPAPIEIAFNWDQQSISAPVKQKKPTGVVLAAPSVFESSMRQPSNGKPRIRLSNAILDLSQQGGAPAIISSIRLYDWGQGTFSIKIASSVNANTPARDMMAHLLMALSKLQQEGSVKALMLSGIEHCFPHGSREEYNEALEQKLYHALVSFPCPVIATLPGNVIGAGLLGAALCDFMVCSEDATYGYTDAQNRFYPRTAETVLFSERFGAVQAQDLLFVTTAATGRQLRTKGWTCPIVPAAEVESYAQQLASSLVTKSGWSGQRADTCRSCGGDRWSIGHADGKGAFAGSSGSRAYSSRYIHREGSGH